MWFIFFRMALLKKHEEPIVESIEDAISALKQNVVDTLIVDNLICKK